jgi:hypothetical protein
MIALALLSGESLASEAGHSKGRKIFLYDILFCFLF